MMKRSASLATAVLVTFLLVIGSASTSLAANPKHALYKLETALERIFGGPDLCFSLKGGITFQQYQNLLRSDLVPKDVARACRKHIVFSTLASRGDPQGNCRPFPKDLEGYAKNAILVWGDDNNVAVGQEGQNASFNLVDGDGNTLVINQSSNGNISIIKVIGSGSNISVFQGGSGGNKFFGVFLGDGIDFETSQSGGESCSVTVKAGVGGLYGHH